MPRRRRRPAPLAATLTELAVAVPQVVGHRVARMALAGAVPSERDRREFAGMVLEKQLAFAQSWQAMFAAALETQQAVAEAWLAAATGRTDIAARAAHRAHQASATVLSVGLAPLHRKAVANARRLGKARRR